MVLKHNPRLYKTEYKRKQNIIHSVRFHGLLATYVEALFQKRGNFKEHNLPHSEMTRHIIDTIDKEDNMVLVRFLSRAEGKAFVEELRRFRDILGFENAFR